MLKITTIFFLILSVILIFETSVALICKQCNVNCDEMVDEECLEPGDDQEIACLVETFKNAENTTLYQRKCVLYAKGTKFECVDYPGYKSMTCVTCKTDRCNGAISRNGTNRGNIRVIVH